ncbi:MAG: metalloregulator ArsR/SmtB family transcription factor [Chromatiaceae bacterium]|jgi:ArsR family transcriptional regulator
MLVAPDSLFAAMAHDTRLRALMLLVGQGELCVCELTYALGLSQPNVSRHLAQLREAGLATDRRAGIWVYYRINPELPAWVTQILEQTARGVKDQAPYREDAAVLAEMPNRPGASCCA